MPPRNAHETRQNQRDGVSAGSLPVSTPDSTTAAASAISARDSVAELAAAAVPFAVAFRRAGSDDTSAFSLGGDDWRHALQLALQHGWQPAGALPLVPPSVVIDPITGARTLTTPPGGFVPAERRGDIDAYLKTPCRIDPDDCAALAGALERSGDLGAGWVLATLRRPGELGVDVL
jgi:hypothetical protein